MSILAIILGILQLVAALPQIIEAVEKLWALIRGLSDRKQRQNYRRLVRNAVMSNVDTKAKTYKAVPLVDRLQHLHNCIAADFNLQMQAHQKELSQLNTYAAKVSDDQAARLAAAT